MFSQGRTTINKHPIYYPYGNSGAQNVLENYSGSPETLVNVSYIMEYSNAN